MDKDEARFQAVRADHYLHWAALFGAGILTGYHYGWLWGIATVVALWLIISATNALLIISTGNHFTWTVLRANRWGWVILVYGLILI